MRFSEARRKIQRTRSQVRARAKGIITETWQSQANLSLFLILEVVISFVLPVTGFGRDNMRLYTAIGYSIMLISGVAIAWWRPRLLIVGALVTIVALAARWLDWWRDTLTTQLWSDGAAVAAVLMISWILLTQVFRQGRITHVRVQGAIAVYLMLGAGWAHAYHIVQLLHPGSFNVESGQLSTVGDWSYFSFVTLTTVGYGDITPVQPIARTLAVAEALTGQLYLAVMVARLVAMEMVFWQQNATESPDQ